jgi:hypothetical protein
VTDHIPSVKQKDAVLSWAEGAGVGVICRGAELGARNGVFISKSPYGVKAEGTS